MTARVHPKREQIRELRRQGLTFAGIAKQLHCCRTAAWREAADIKNPDAKRRVKYTDEQIKTIREMRRGGARLREISVATQIPLPSLYHHCYNVYPGARQVGQAGQAGQAVRA